MDPCFPEMEKKNDGKNLEEGLAALIAAGP